VKIIFVGGTVSLLKVDTGALKLAVVNYSKSGHCRVCAVYEQYRVHVKLVK
jgi:hypothetical protein